MKSNQPSARGKPTVIRAGIPELPKQPPLREIDCTPFPTIAELKDFIALGIAGICTSLVFGAIGYLVIFDAFFRTLFIALIFGGTFVWSLTKLR